MKRSHLKAVQDAGEKNVVPVKTEHAPEARGTWLENTRLPTLIDEMERLMNEMLHRPLLGMGMLPFRGLFPELGRLDVISPSVDVYEDDDNLFIKADLPGVTKEDITLKVVDNNLEISCEKKSEENIDQRDYLRLERTYGKFSRSLPLPEGLDHDRITAKYEGGVLEVKLPKVEDSKRMVRKISVK